jgi:hypothetical protein
VGNPDIDGRIILRRIIRKWDVGCMDWIELVQDKTGGRAFVTVVMNLRFP